MRVFKFWNIAETTVLIDGVAKSISCFGGSNYSESDALNDGYQRLEAVKRRIAGTEKGKGPDYQADIREEPLLWIEDRDVITRNRYGAEVLNSTSCTSNRKTQSERLLPLGNTFESHNLCRKTLSRSPILPSESITQRQGNYVSKQNCGSFIT